MKARVLGLLLLASIACAPLAHASYSNLYVFGDSLSDTGNVSLAIGAGLTGVPQTVTGNTYIPGAPYFPSGTFSNGPVWVNTFASGLGLSATPSLLGGNIYAFGGAQTSGGTSPSLMLQTGMFLAGSGGVADGNALYVLAGGGNNARAALEAIGGGADIGATIAAAAASYAADIDAMVNQLQAAGAHDIVVWNTPNLGLAPAVAAGGAGASFLGSLIAGAMNNALALAMSDEADVRVFDVFGLVSGIALNPGAYGLSNVTDACGALASCDGFLFWDGIHPTAQGHAILGNAMLAAVPEPETYALMLAGLVVLGWHARRRERKGAAA